MKTISILIAILALVGCSREIDVEGFLAGKELDKAKQYAQVIQAGDVGAIEALMNPEKRSNAIDERIKLRNAIRKMVSQLPKDEPLNVLVIGGSTRTFDDKWYGNYSFQFQYPKDWAVISVGVTKVGDSFYMEEANVSRLEKSYKK